MVRGHERPVGMLLVGLLALTPFATWAAPPPLPDPMLFGADWTMIARASGPADAPRWQSASYGGPHGARIFLTLVDASDPAVMRDSWTGFTDGMQQLKYKVQNGKDGPTTPLAGCGSVARLGGADALNNDFPVGYTACADDAGQRILWVAVSGQALGATGTDASDAVVTAILRQGAATPSP